MIEQMFASTPQMASTIGAFSDACEATYFGSGGGACPMVAGLPLGRLGLTPVPLRDTVPVHCRPLR